MPFRALVIGARHRQRSTTDCGKVRPQRATTPPADPRQRLHRYARAMSRAVSGFDPRADAGNETRNETTLPR